MTVLPVDIQLSDEEIEACLSSSYLKIPDRTGIVRGARFSMSVKIGGRMQLSMVICKGKPRQKALKDGRKVWVVDVYGIGVNGEVWISKLRERAEAQRG